MENKTRYSCNSFTVLIILLLEISISTVYSLNQQEMSLIVSLLNTNVSWSGAKSSRDPCTWNGVKCINDENISELHIAGIGLRGNKPWRVFCGLRNLQILDVSNNFLSVPSDEEIRSCNGLRILNISNNSMAGSLPSLAPLGRLQRIDASNNILRGSFGDQIEGLKDLQVLNVSRNVLTSQGERFPERILDCSKLFALELSQNRLSGQIPRNISGLRGLQTLSLSTNNFSGSIPSSIGQLKRLQILDVSQNSLSGSLPEELTLLAQLSSLSLSYNQFTGSIPRKIFGLSNLKVLDLSRNKLEGTIPNNFSDSLMRLRLGENRLNGSIPSRIGSLTKLAYLELNGNVLDGEIPQELGYCTSLLLLDLSNNSIYGRVDSKLKPLVSLEVLKLSKNYFNGSILNEVSAMTNLTYLDLSHNFFSEEINPRIFELQGLQKLYLQNNRFSGSIPRNIGRSMLLLELQMGRNNFSGKIPFEIGQLRNLQISLNLSYNSLQGKIPATISFLSSLVILDLSYNNLSGDIPSLNSMLSLSMLNVSNNMLTGSVPKAKQLTVFYSGNPGLCDDLCASASAHKKSSSGLLIGVAVGSAVFALVAVAFSAVLYRYFRGSDRQVTEVQLPQRIEGRFVCIESVYRESIDFEKGIEATTDTVNVVLKSKTSVYYKAVMPSGANYLVKKLGWRENMLASGNYQKFGAELEKHAAKLRHPNIMMPLAYVLQVDSAFLFFEYKFKGTLSDFLHGNSVAMLDWISRKSIAIGVAEGLAFMHSCRQPVYHLDLTSRSIFLRSSTVPLIGDVELCKIIDPGKSSGSVSAVNGTVGYIPPEYAYTMRVNAAGNVYSFGVILLELLTGKPPVNDGIDLVKWVQLTLAKDESWDAIFDPKVGDSTPARGEMMSMLKVALKCINAAPNSRPDMKAIVGMLEAGSSDL